MANLKHLIIGTLGGKNSADAHEVDLSPMFASLQHLAVLETLDVGLISTLRRRGEDGADAVRTFITLLC